MIARVVGLVGAWPARAAVAGGPGRLRRLVSLAGLLSLVAALSACYGPKPEVVGHELRPPEAPGAPYLMVVTVKNTGGGEGQAVVNVKLRSRATGETVAAADQTADLKAHETAQVTVELRPAAPGPYDELVEVQYPAR